MRKFYKKIGYIVIVDRLGNKWSLHITQTMKWKKIRTRLAYENAIELGILIGLSNILYMLRWLRWHADRVSLKIEQPLNQALYNRRRRWKT